MYRGLVAMSSIWCVIGCSVYAKPAPVTPVFYDHHEAPQNRLIDRPELNPTLTKTVTIRGGKDPSFELMLLYATNATSCNTQTLIARIQGAPDVAQVITDSVRIPAGEGSFSATFSLDRYLPGRCDWKPVAIHHAEFEPKNSIAPPVKRGLVSLREKSPTETDLMFTCQQEAQERDQNKYLNCSLQSSIDNMTTSVEGGVVNVHFLRAPQAGRR